MEKSVSFTLGESRAAWWQGVFESAEDPQFVCSCDGEVHEANARAVQAFGVAVDSPGFLSLLRSIVTPATFRKLIEIMKRSPRRAETTTSISLLFGGRIRQMADLQLIPLDERFWLVCIKDASRRWRMESHVQRLVTALDATPDVFYLTDAEFRLTFVNAAFQTVTGHTIEDALGQTADFLRADPSKPACADYLKAIKAGNDWSGELLNLRADGVRYPVELVVSPIHDRNGKIAGYVACERDITSKKKLQEDVIRERNYVGSIINSIDAAIYTVDRKYRLTHVSEGWRKLPSEHGWLKLKGEPKPGEALLELAGDIEKEIELRMKFGEALERRTPVEFDARSGSHRWRVVISPLLHEREVTGLIYTVIDHTKFHELQSQLYQVQKMETIGALAAGVAHDFNNLLQVIRGNVTMLAQEDELSRDSRLLQIEQAAARAADITDQLLSFSRASDEKITVFDFNKLVKEITQLLQRSKRGNVDLKFEHARHLLKVRMDANRAHQLVLNLCVNAQDAMSEGGRLTIRTEAISLPARIADKIHVPAGRQYLCCTVEDTGCGIPAEIMHRIFDPFFTTKGAGKGTGLGLSIAHSVVSQAQGDLEVESVVGKGTTFRIYLPLVDVEETEVKIASRGLAKGSGRVLLVEDLDLVRDFTQSFLKTAGFNVLVACNGAEAVKVLESESENVDLVFTDYNMPEMNGVELIREVASRWPGVKFILVSGYLDEDERLRIIEETGASILKKPYNVREATDLIMQVLAASRAT